MSRAGCPPVRGRIGGAFEQHFSALKRTQWDTAQDFARQDSVTNWINSGHAPANAWLDIRLRRDRMKTPRCGHLNEQRTGPTGFKDRQVFKVGTPRRGVQGRTGLSQDWFDRACRKAILVRLTFHNRHSLPHNVPLWVDPQKEVYFITINCKHRGRTQLILPELAGPLLDTVKLRNERRIWFAHIFLLMPDHIHALLSFPPSPNTVQQTITLWKRWTGRQMGIKWQRDFFEHRLRSDESWREKADYILANPVRKGLVNHVPPRCRKFGARCLMRR